MGLLLKCSFETEETLQMTDFSVLMEYIGDILAFTTLFPQVN
jgi:hypothetical protein